MQSNDSTPAVAGRNRTRPVLFAVALAALAGAAWWLWHRPVSAAEPAAMAGGPSHVAAPDDGGVAPAMLRVAVVHAQPLPLAEPLSAHLAYDEDHTARLLPSWAGRIARVNVAVGDAVKAGQALAEVDSPDFGSAQADLAKAESDLALKQHALARAQELLDATVIARKDYEQARADCEQAQAEAQRARLRVAHLLPSGQVQRGERIPLSTPLAGWVTERAATPGLELGAGATAPLFVVSDLRHLWLTIDLPEHLLSQLHVGAAVQVTVDAWPDEAFTARLDRIGLVVDPNTRRVPVRAVLDNADLRLKPEMYARVVVPRPDNTQAIAVPNSALVGQGYDTQVFVQTGEGRYERRVAQVALRGNDRSYLASGVHDGESVVVQGALLLAAQLSDAPASGATDNAKPVAVHPTAQAEVAAQPAGRQP